MSDSANYVSPVEVSFQTAVRHVMVHVMLAEGPISPEELGAAADTFLDLFGQDIPREAFLADAEMLAGQRQSLVDYLRRYHAYLDAHAREQALRAAWAVAAADASLKEAEWLFIRELCGALDITEAHLRGLLLCLEEGAHQPHLTYASQQEARTLH